MVNRSTHAKHWYLIIQLKQDKKKARQVPIDEGKGTQVRKVHIDDG